jgi:hypothetical protein
LLPIQSCQFLQHFCLNVFTLVTVKQGFLSFLKWVVKFQHSWASASRLMPPASAFGHPVSQSSTGAFRYWTGSPIFRYRSGSGIGIIPVPADWMPDSPTFRHLERGTPPCTSILLAVERDTPCTYNVYTAGGRKAISECRRKVSPAWASGIRVQSGTAGQGLVRHCPA